MSVELRFDIDNNVVCDWGVIEHSNPRPDRDEVGHLMLITRDYFGLLFKEGPREYHGTTHSVDAVPVDEIVTDDTILRLYAHLDYCDQRWIWELFEAHWWDGAARLGTPDLYVGRWPD